MTPTEGSKVRLIKINGAAADSLRANVGRVGTVVRAAERDGGVVVVVRFASVDGAQSFWLKPGEFEVVE